jgi:hypothetical protein
MIQRPVCFGRRAFVVYELQCAAMKALAHGCRVDEQTQIPVIEEL